MFLNEKIISGKQVPLKDSLSPTTDLFTPAQQQEALNCILGQGFRSCGTVMGPNNLGAARTEDMPLNVPESSSMPSRVIHNHTKCYCLASGNHCSTNDS